ncbi:MAG: hypothetical protein CMD16_04490 [Flavobacteriales bacterium]|nr:hypothetical protein [Flavobacteriales bacterium]
MTKKFTQNLLRSFILFLLFSLISPVISYAQNCNVPIGLNTTNISNFSTTLNWDLDTNVHHYRLRYKEAGGSSWSYEHNATGTSEDVGGLNNNTAYIWQAKAFCSPLNTPNSSWSVIDTFITANYPVDCNNTPNGSAYLDSCGNCVEGTTGKLPCIDFSPNVAIFLSDLNCNSPTDFSFSFSQDPNEPDVSSSVFSSDGGYFDFSGINPDDTIGSSINIAGGGFLSTTTTLLVDFIVTTDKISVKSIDNTTLQILSSFTIENTSSGILIVATSLPDNNNVTSGNSQDFTLSALFVNPGAGVLTFTSTINSEFYS